MLFFERLYSPGLAHLSYIFGDGGQAVVIDPRRDCRAYVEIAHRHGAAITHIFETHRNEDYVTGSAPLAGLTGAQIYHGANLPFRFGAPVRAGDRFEIGKLRLGILETPGHTPESISITLADLRFSEDPVAVFTGDALFIGDVGRTDLNEDPAAGADALYDSVRRILALGDGVLLYPAHGAGSVCGANLAQRSFSSLGFENAHSRVLQLDRRAFVEYKLAENPYRPPYFEQMEQVNLGGAPLHPDPPVVPPAAADEFADLLESKALVPLDIREPEAFSGGHIPRALSIPLDLVPSFAGYLLSFEQGIGLIADGYESVRTAMRYLFRLGYDDVPVFLQGGMSSWTAAGRLFESIPGVGAAELKARLDRDEPLTVLDVRQITERRQEGAVPGSMAVYVGELPQKLDEVPRDKPVVTYCDRGARAMIAASILQRNGYDDVEYFPGSFQAWTARGLPVEEEKQAVAV
jgi:hydroxyacylglutathione hydrolase